MIDVTFYDNTETHFRPKRSSVNAFLTAKFDKCDKNKHDVFSRKVSNAQEKVRGMLKAAFFVSALLNLGLDNNSKREMNFFSR